MPVREPGERAITEEEIELSRNAKTLLDAGLNPESFLELTAVMSRSMQTIAASLTSVFGEAFLQAGDTERDLGLRYAEAMRHLGPMAGPTLQHMLNLRLREQMREAVIGQAELQTGRLAGSQPITVGFVDIVGFTKLGEDVAPEDLGAGGQELRASGRGRGRATGAAREDDRRRGDAGGARSPGPWWTRSSGLVERSQRARSRCCAAAWRPGRDSRERATGTGAP